MVRVRDAMLEHHEVRFLCRIGKELTVHLLGTRYGARMLQNTTPELSRQLEKVGVHVLGSCTLIFESLSLVSIRAVVLHAMLQGTCVRSTHT